MHGLKTSLYPVIISLYIRKTTYIYIYIISNPLSLYAQPELTFFTTHSQLNSETLHAVPLWRSCHCFSLPTVAVAFGQQQQLDRDGNNNNSCRFSLTLDQMPIVVVVTVELMLLFSYKVSRLRKRVFSFFASPANLCVSLANSPCPLPPLFPLLFYSTPYPRNLSLQA